MTPRWLVAALALATLTAAASAQSPHPAPLAATPALAPSSNGAVAPVAGCPPAGPCDPACEPCPTAYCDCLCGPPGRAWVSAEWLYWAASGNPVPALITTSPVGTAQTVAGVPGLATTSTVFGDRRYGGDFRSGFRLSGGVWLDECQRCGVEGDFFFLGRERDSARFGSPTGAAVVARPFFNALTGVPDAQLVSFPGVLAGTAGVDAYTDVIGGGGGLVKNLCCDPCLGRLDLTLGYRYLGVTDDLTITEDLVALPGSGVPAGTAIRIRDHFRAENQFHGPAVGLALERRFNDFYLGLRTSVALGVNHQVVTIDGSTVITGPTGAVTAAGPGGLLTAPSNIGTYTRDEFAVVPEVGLRLGYQVTPALRAFFGYNFIYLSDAVRSGDLIDPRVNPNQLVPPVTPPTGPAVPAFAPRSTDFWLHGISLGAEVRFF